MDIFHKKSFVNFRLRKLYNSSNLPDPCIHDNYYCNSDGLNAYNSNCWEMDLLQVNKYALGNGNHTTFMYKSTKRKNQMDLKKTYQDKITIANESRFLPLILDTGANFNYNLCKYQNNR